MSKHVEALERQDEALEALNKMLNEGQHSVEGLTIAIGVGTGSCISFSVVGNTHEILRELRDGLEITRGFRLKLAEMEAKEIAEYLNNHQLERI